MGAILERMFVHNLWANLRLIDACAGLSQGSLDATVPGTYGTIRDTLAHLVGAEERYLSAFVGEQPTSPLQREEVVGLPELRELARRSGEGFVTAAARFHDDEVVHGVRRNGQPFALPASTLFLQAINHATEHRAQVSTILTQVGVEPPVMDGWTYDREQPVAP